jgi:hypothetical protein
VVYFPAVTACRSVVVSSEHDAWRWCSARDVLRRLPHANLRRLFESYLRKRTWR